MFSVSWTTHAGLHELSRAHHELGGKYFAVSCLNAKKNNMFCGHVSCIFVPAMYHVLHNRLYTTVTVGKAFVFKTDAATAALQIKCKGVKQIKNIIKQDIQKDRIS